MPERDRAPDAALLTEADEVHARHSIVGADCACLACRLAASLRAHHAALDGATVVTLCACGHMSAAHRCHGKSLCRCAVFTPTRERITYEREIDDAR